jgi:hypothetical protein
MNGLRKWTLLTLILLSAGFAQAQEIPLQNITESEFKDVVGELSTNFLHTTVSGAGTLGSVWGFEVGLVGGITKTPDIDALAKRGDPSVSVDQLPNAALVGAVTVPLAITVEASLLPKIGSDKFKYNTFSLAAKWSPSELFFDLPVDFAVKALMTKTGLTFKDTINGVDTTFDYDDTQWGLEFLVSKNFAIVEPYFVLGMVSSKGTMDVTGSTTVFANSYTTDQSASVKQSGVMWALGAQLKLTVLHFGVEYMRMFGATRYTGKLSLAF